MIGEAERNGEGWAILEKLGHLRLGGMATNAVDAFVRSDIRRPNKVGMALARQDYGPSAVYAITWTTRRRDADRTAAVTMFGDSRYREPENLWHRRTRPAGERARGQRERESRPWVRSPSLPPPWCA